jgi:hypothetical protein
MKGDYDAGQRKRAKGGEGPINQRSEKESGRGKGATFVIGIWIVDRSKK